MVQNESEYKYLINKLPTFENYKRYYFKQTYFTKNTETLQKIKSIFPKLNEESIEGLNTFRIRKIVDERIQYILTLKSKGLFTRREYEEEITEEDYLFFFKYAEKIIKKNRYIEVVDNFTFEFDEYLNTIEKLLTVEVETNITPENQKKIEDILSKNYNLVFQDVTNEKKYKNKYLEVNK